MKKTFLKAFAATLAAVSTFAITANADFAKTKTYTEGQFTDVPATEWYASSVKDAFEFGIMNGKDGKPFKTRDGGVMRLEYLISDINDKMYEKIMENRSVSEEEARETSKVVGLAALKYGDLSNQASKDYVFDIDRFASFEGNTGPYILYTIVRIKSILIPSSLK